MDSVENQEVQNGQETLLYPYAAADDALLVVASLLGNLDAFDTLARRYREAVQFIARQWVGNDNDTAAQDITQDVFIAAFQALPHLEEPAKFAGWLYAITRNRARRVAEQERRTQPTKDSTLEALTDASAMRRQNRPRQTEIWEALEQISPEHREVLYLHYCEEWPLVQISDFLTVPETTVKGRLHRAREALRRLLVPESQTSTAQNLQTPKGSKKP